MARLRRSDPHAPGITRRRRGKGFSYHWQSDNTPVTDPETLERIAALAIPPAWTGVWICPWPHGHIQATGTDAAGRRQYRYHDLWRKRRDAEKFERMLRFGHALPGARERVASDLQLRGYPRERVLAAAVRLLDVGYFRSGGEEYAEEHESFGLATLERSHVTVRGRSMAFDYPAKSGQRRRITILDDEVAPLVKSLQRRKGGNEDLLAWRDGREWVDLRAEDLNAYVKETTGEEFSAKDFRTWSATVLAAVVVATASQETSSAAGRRLVRAVCGQVSTQLGNTPAVCKASYIDPRVFDRHEAGDTIVAALAKVGETAPLETGDSETVAAVFDVAARGRIEQAVLSLLEEDGGAVTAA